jgi:Ca-activated chloride channel family protein
VRLEAPLALLALLIVPLALLGYALLERRPSRYAVRFTNIEVLEQASRGSVRWRSHVPAALMLLALTCALGALARPQQRVVTARPQASVVLAVDASGSMAAGDVAPTRMGAAREAIGRFLARLPSSYRVGLVIFASEAYVAAPLTRDRTMVLRTLDLARAPGKGTAIGDALVRSVDVLDPSSALGSGTRRQASVAPSSDGSPPAILLLSDGAQTRGRLTPLQGAARAGDRAIPVHTVALGTPDGVISEGVISLRVPPDPVTLQRISAATGGEFSVAIDEASLNAVYERLASELGWELHWRELGPLLLALAALLALAGIASSLVIQQRML